MLCGGKEWDSDEGGVNLSECWDYFPCNNTWQLSLRVPPMAEARTGAAAILTSFPGSSDKNSAGSYWVLGGSDDEGDPRNTTEILDLNTNTWSAGGCCYYDTIPLSFFYYERI